jgi:TonB-dependent SusC/RagA subfamily outer membrane receptor
MSNSAGALVVIDGVTRPGSILWTLSPTQIKSINVIKDGSSAVYGINGANGVIVVETKR